MRINLGHPDRGLARSRSELHALARVYTAPFANRHKRRTWLKRFSELMVVANDALENLERVKAIAVLCGGDDGVCLEDAIKITGGGWPRHRELIEAHGYDLDAHAFDRKLRRYITWSAGTRLLETDWSLRRRCLGYPDIVELALSPHSVIGPYSHFTIRAERPPRCILVLYNDESQAFGQAPTLRFTWEPTSLRYAGVSDPDQPVLFVAAPNHTQALGALRSTSTLPLVEVGHAIHRSRRQQHPRYYDPAQVSLTFNGREVYVFAADFLETGAFDVETTGHRPGSYAPVIIDSIGGIGEDLLPGDQS